MSVSLEEVTALIRMRQELGRLHFAACWWCLNVERSKTPFELVSELHTFGKRYFCKRHKMEGMSLRSAS